MNGWLIAGFAVLFVMQLITIFQSGESEETLSRLSRASTFLELALRDKATVKSLADLADHLNRLRGALKFSEDAQDFSGVFLMMVGVVLGLFGSFFTDWVLHGPGIAPWVAWTPDSPGVLGRMAVVVAIGAVLSFGMARGLMPWAYRWIGRHAATKN